MLALLLEAVHLFSAEVVVILRSPLAEGVDGVFPPQRYYQIPACHGTGLIYTLSKNIWLATRAVLQ